MGVLKEATYEKHLAQFLAHGKCSLNINAPSQETTNAILNVCLYPVICLSKWPFVWRHLHFSRLQFPYW